MLWRDNGIVMSGNDDNSGERSICGEWWVVSGSSYTHTR